MQPFGIPKPRYRNERLAWNPREAETSTNSIQSRTRACQTWRKNRQLKKTKKCHHHHDLSLVVIAHCHPRQASDTDICRRNASFSAIYRWLALAVNVFGRPPCPSMKNAIIGSSVRMDSHLTSDHRLLAVSSCCNFQHRCDWKE